MLGYAIANPAYGLNQIIANDFDKEQALKELNAQTVITTEFGREAPKAVADFADNQAFKLIQKLDELNDKNIDITSDEYQNTIKEIDKWGEGGIYRIALHTATAAIATGTIEGAVTTGGVAAAAPTIDKLSEQITEQLIKAGISEDTAQNATSLITSLAIATATQSAGVDASSTAMAVNADAFNRQLHANKGEAWVIEELYKRQGGNKKWSRKQIANALRAANFRKKASKPGERDFYESANSHNVVPSNRPDLGYDTLVGVQWNNNGAGISLNIPKVDPNLVRYIQSHAGKGDFASYHYTWNNNRIANNQQPLSAPRVTRVPHTDYSRSLEAHNTAVMNNPPLVACALNETRHCREMDQKGMEAMTNASHFIPGGQYLRPVTGTLAVASKIENEGFGRTVVGLGVSTATERVVRTPQTSAIVDQIGTNDAITNAIYDSCISQNVRGEQKHECK